MAELVIPTVADAARIAAVINARSRSQTGISEESPDSVARWFALPDLAVRRPWRRRGLGEALLREAFVALGAAGKRRAGLGVDAENTTGAVALYKRVGMHVVRRSDTWELSA